MNLCGDLPCVQPWMHRGRTCCILDTASDKTGRIKSSSLRDNRNCSQITLTLPANLQNPVSIRRCLPRTTTRMTIPIHCQQTRFLKQPKWYGCSPRSRTSERLASEGSFSWSSRSAITNPQRTCEYIQILRLRTLVEREWSALTLNEDPFVELETALSSRSSPIRRSERDGSFANHCCSCRNP